MPGSFPEGGKPESFTCFHSLPAELQLQVWSLSLPRPPRTIKLRLHELQDAETDTSSIFLTSTSTPEPLLFITRFSRDVVLRGYASIKQPNTDFIIRFNQNLDILYMTQPHDRTNYPVLPGTTWFGGSTDPDNRALNPINPIFSETFKNISHLAVDLKWLQTFKYNEDDFTKYLFTAHFPNLEEFILVPHPDVGAGLKEGEFPCFSTSKDIASAKCDIELQDFDEWRKSISQHRKWKFLDGMQDVWIFGAKAMLGSFQADVAGSLRFEIAIMGVKIDLERQLRLNENVRGEVAGAVWFISETT